MARIHLRLCSFTRLKTFFGLICIFWLSATSGCALLEKCVLTVPKDTHEAVGHIDMAFPPFIFFVDDTVNPGRTVPCLMGRVYLFSEDSTRTVTGQGKIHAELFDTTDLAKGKPPVRVAEWNFEPRALKMVRRPDKIGMGYTLMLPLVEYQPSMKKVMLRLNYVDENNESHEANPATLALRPAEEPPQVFTEEKRGVLANTLSR
jgi:hypothetical protein